MSTPGRSKGRTPPAKREDASQLRPDVAAAIVSAWPDGEIGIIPVDAEESWFWDVHPSLASAFQHIEGARLLYEREAEPEPAWTDWDDDDDPPFENEFTRSYHLFFVSPADKAFEFETETENAVEPEFDDEYGEDWDGECDEDWEGELETVTVQGQGHIGWAVAVSMIAPFAVIALNNYSTFEDGSSSEPAIEQCAQDDDGNVVNPEEHFRKFHGELLFQKLEKLRTRIAGILEKQGVIVLPETEWRKVVPGLVGNGDALVGDAIGQPIRVLDAFFFQSM
jgi:hypothetical protein